LTAKREVVVQVVEVRTETVKGLGKMEKVTAAVAVTMAMEEKKKALWPPHISLKDQKQCSSRRWARLKLVGVWAV
jgi:hypothetical protein